MNIEMKFMNRNYLNITPLSRVFTAKNFSDMLSEFPSPVKVSIIHEIIQHTKKFNVPFCKYVIKAYSEQNGREKVSQLYDEAVVFCGAAHMRLTEQVPHMRLADEGPSLMRLTEGTGQEETALVTTAQPID